MPPEFCSHGVAWGWCPFTGCRGFRDRNPPPNLDPCPECLGTGKRPRNRNSLALGMTKPCEACKGSGKSAIAAKGGAA